MSRISDALARIEMARQYTLHLLSHVSPDDWFRMPQQGVTHVAWQVGHLAIAEYRLALERIRGIRPDDAQFLPANFMERFGRGSVPVADPAAYPPASQIRAVFDAVHLRVREEVAPLDDAVLDEPALAPHPLFKDKLGALVWCSHHEMLHAGQIGLLRRLLGETPMV